MKNIRIQLFFVFFTLSTVFASGEKLHLITFCATDDPKIGSSVQVDHDHVIAEVANIADYIGFELVNYDYYGQKCTKFNLDKVLSSLSVGRNDVVFFYYSGHGGRSSAQQNDLLPQMCLGQTRLENLFVPVRKVKEMLQKRGGRLNIILTDCCNNPSSSITPKVIEMPNAKGATMRDAEDVYYKKLFLEQKGTITTTSSKAGQTSGCYIVVDNGQRVDLGGYYTVAFFYVLDAIGHGNLQADWNTLIQSTKKITLRLTDNGQEPYTDPSMPQGVTPITPSPTPSPVNPINNPSIGGGTSTNSTLTNDIAFLLDKSVSADTRLAAIPKIIERNFVSADSYVITVGRDMHTNVDSETARTFLRRICLSKDIHHIDVIRQNGAKNSTIVVHEVRTR